MVIMLMVDGGIGGDGLTIAFNRTPTNMYYFPCTMPNAGFYHFIESSLLQVIFTDSPQIKLFFLISFCGNG